MAERITYGKTWWGQQWLNALTSIDMANRLPRGKTYANKGAVQGLSISQNQISASIKDNENEDTEDSPAAAIPKILWPNQSKIWTHDSSLKKSTFTCDTLLDKVFSVRIKIIKGGIGALTLGVSSTELDTGKRYLGGDLGPGNWGIAGSKVLGEEGNWRYDSLPFNLNDILTISGNNGVIRYTVNDQDNSSYQYDMKTTNLYLAASLNEGDIMEILD